MDRSPEPQARRQSGGAWLRAITLGLASLLAVPLIVDTQVLDICGCATIPGLQPFDSTNPATHPPGTTVNGTTVNIAVPPDGILRFSSLFARNHLTFQRNAANTPVTILVSGDVTFSSATGCCWNVSVTGDRATDASASAPGVGGLGGPGGFRGGDGAQMATNGFSIGGAGFGPGGGTGGTPASCPGGLAQFFGAPDLIPMLGGGGGGGGCSSTPSPSSCSAGGGGGGGGGLIIAANGTISVTGGYRLLADGGGGGFTSNGACAYAGAGGSGGAIRLLANRFITTSTAELFARGGNNPNNGVPSGAGRIRIESMDSSVLTAFSSTDPPAQRIVGPTPLANPVAPSVNITSVGGQAVPAVPQGSFGTIDVVIPVPGTTNIDLATTGVPGGTTVMVTAKPRLGPALSPVSVPLATCNSAGSCQATAVFNLAAGAYVIEARATFQTQ
jgi:hypothetical protein